MREPLYDFPCSWTFRQYEAYLNAESLPDIDPPREQRDWRMTNEELDRLVGPLRNVRPVIQQKPRIRPESKPNEIVWEHGIDG